MDGSEQTVLTQIRYQTLHFLIRVLHYLPLIFAEMTLTSIHNVGFLAQLSHSDKVSFCDHILSLVRGVSMCVYVHPYIRQVHWEVSICIGVWFIPSLWV